MAARDKFVSLVVVAIVTLVYNAEHVDSSADIMRDIAKGFAKGLEECRKELNNEEGIMAELYHFWKEDYEKVGRVVGCTIVCMSRKLDLLGEDLKMHHGNAEQFAKNHGADETIAKKIVELIHGCEKANDGEPDECLRTLEVAKCFRSHMNELNWTPKIKEVLGEIIVDI